jgi:hypothetical protein
VTVSPDHHIAWKDQSFLREKGMLDPHLSDFKIMGEAMGFGEISEDFTLFGR